MHCNRQFTDSLSIDECSKAVTEAFEGGYSCFPMGSVVNRRSDGKIPLYKLRIGDEVLVSSDEGLLKYDEVIAFLHWSKDKKYTFLRLSYGDSGNSLTIHKDHYIPVQSSSLSRSFISANDVNIGDQIQSIWIDGTLIDTPITCISEVEEQGLCCPLTLSGRIIVDGVDCSCYSPPSGFLPFNVSHQMCHLVMGPVRLHYQWNRDKLLTKEHGLPSCTKNEGLHPYARLLMTAVTGVIFS